MNRTVKETSWRAEFAQTNERLRPYPHLFFTVTVTVTLTVTLTFPDARLLGSRMWTRAAAPSLGY